MRDDTDIPPVTLSSRHLPRGGSMLADLEAYWHDLRGARALPARTEVNPAAIDAVLPHAFVAERVAPRVARLRVAGQAVSALLGMEARGMPLCTLFAPESQEMVGDLLARVFDDPAIVEAPLSAARGLGRPRLSGRLLLLPLTDAQGTVNRVIGAILCDGSIGRAPRRLTIPEGGALRIAPVGLPAPLRAPAPRLAAAAGGATVQGGPRSARPALRLVVDNA